MRSAAMVLVLILGAGMILWFGNTLNPWVLGGLVGGLAALLFSIPISVMLFLHLSRSHEAQYGTRGREEHSHLDYFDRLDEDCEGDHRVTVEPLPPYLSYPRLPMPAQQGNRALISHPTPDHRKPSARVPGSRQPASQRSYRGQHQTIALRVARREAALCRTRVYDVPATTSSVKKTLNTHSLRADANQDHSSHAFVARSSCQVPQQRTHSFRPRRTVEALPPLPQTPRSLPRKGESTNSRSQSSPARSLGTYGIDTEQLRTGYTETGPVRLHKETLDC